jgi:peptidoglycan hydrolase-like protein with peptidoglycan-binding domain
VVPTDSGRDKRRVASLQLGDEGPEVAELQLRLSQLAFYTGPTGDTYTVEVEDAVRRYQRARGITEDQLGVYGGTTRSRLESETRRP